MEEKVVQPSIFHLGLISVEIFKKDNKVRYQLTIPLGSSWDDAIAICDEFKDAIVDMKKAAQAQESQMKAEKEAVALEPEIV